MRYIISLEEESSCEYQDLAPGNYFSLTEPCQDVGHIFFVAKGTETDENDFPINPAVNLSTGEICDFYPDTEVTPLPSTFFLSAETEANPYWNY